MILGIETATEVCSVALVRGGKVMAERSVNEKNIHSERLLSLIDEVLTETRSTMTTVKGIAVSIGPGSFTGLRIGLSTAKGLAMACGLPIIAVPTLDGIAEQFRRRYSGKDVAQFCSMVDAKRNESFYAFYDVTEREISKTSVEAIKPKDEIVAEAQRRGAVIDQPGVGAASVALLGESKRNEFELSDFSQLEPSYLRDFVTTAPRKEIIH
jgi:tRNA threonylcarbamoyladenosine biosynthesis protein TsaB